MSMPNTLTVNDLRDRIAAIIEEEQGALLSDTQSLLRFPTVSGGNPEEHKVYLEEIPKALDFLHALSDRMGFTWRQWDNESAEIAWEHGDGRPVVGIAAHIDVVPAAGTWKYPPFSATIADDGFLYSRGIQDDKGPLMQALYGMNAAKRAGLELPVDVRLIIGTCEETGDWGDVTRYLQKRGAPDFAFTPDATFPITNGEKGMSCVKFSSTWDALEPDEETGLEFVSLIAGKRANIVPDLCEIVLRFPIARKNDVMKDLVRATTEFTVHNPGANVTITRETVIGGKAELLVSFIGKAAHGSVPKIGHNAALDGMRFLADVETIPAPVRAYMKFLLFVSEDLDGTNLMVNGTHHFIGETTVNLGVVQMDRNGGHGLLNVRPTMGVSVKQVMANSALAAETFSKTTGYSFRSEQDGKVFDAIYLDPNSPKVAPFLQALQGGFTAVTGEEARLMAIGGSTYSKAFPNCCAFGPIHEHTDEEMAHQADERLAVDSIIRNAKIYGTSIALLQYL